MKLFTISILLLPLSVFGQHTFSHPDTANLVIINHSGYKILFVDPRTNFEVSPNQTQLFKIDTSIYHDIEKAITEQYVSANSKYLDLEEKLIPYPHQPIDTLKLTLTELKSLRRKNILKASENTARKGLRQYDRYYYGFINTKGDKWIYIRFDPHKIKRYKISGESHIANLSPMVYNMTTKELFLAGWSGKGE